MSTNPKQGSTTAAIQMSAAPCQKTPGAPSDGAQLEFECVCLRKCVCLAGCVCVEEWVWQSGRQGGKQCAFYYP